MGEKKNILFIVNSLQFGGAEKHLVSLLNGLSDKKFNFFLACLKDNNSLLSQIRKERLTDRLYCHVTSKLDLGFIRRLAGYIDNHHIDLVVCINQYPMLYGVLAEKFASKAVPVIIIFHTTLILKLKGRLKLLFYRSFFKRCACVVFVSKNQEKYWVTEKNLKVRKTIAIQNGIDLNFFSLKMKGDQHLQLLRQLNFSRDDYIIGLCGALRHEKYHIDAIEAVATVRNAGGNAKLLLIGDGPERGNIEDHILRRELKDAVVITGFQEDVRPFIKLCDCMVITSHSETFSIAALEAMAMGRPMIMTDIGGASEQIEHGRTGFLYEKGDISALAKHILLLSSKSLREKMGQEALLSVQENFSYETMIQKYENLFEASSR